MSGERTPDGDIVLHQLKISPFCGKTRRILAHKALRYRTAEYAGLEMRLIGKLTPVGKLPVLDYGGERVQDSTAIAEFLEERHPDPPLYPRDPVDRARVHFLEDWADEALYWFETYFRFVYAEASRQLPALLCEGRPRWEGALGARIAIRTHVAKVRGQGLGKLSRREVERQFEAHLDQIEILMGDRRAVVGDAPTIADLAIAAQLGEVIRTNPPIGQRVLARERLRAWLADLPGDGEPA